MKTLRTSVRVLAFTAGAATPLLNWSQEAESATKVKIVQRTTHAIEGVGKFTLPPGEWVHETPPVNAGKKVYHQHAIFRKTGDKLEFIIFVRYLTRPEKVANTLDSLSENYWQGMPKELRETPHAPLMIHHLGLKPDRNDAERYDMSTVSEDEKTGEKWLQHSHVFRENGATFAIVHTSPHALVPLTLLDADAKWDP